MKNDVFRQTKRNVQKIEATYGDLEEFILRSTNLDGEHKLRMDVPNLGKIYRQMCPIYADLSDLELADLIDFGSLKNFDGDEFQTW